MLEPGGQVRTGWKLCSYNAPCSHRLDSRRSRSSCPCAALRGRRPPGRRQRRRGSAPRRIDALRQVVPDPDGRQHRAGVAGWRHRDRQPAVPRRQAADQPPGEDHAPRIFATYAGRVPAEADLVRYWFEKAGRQIASAKTARAVDCTRTNPLHWATGTMRRRRRACRWTAAQAGSLLHFAKPWANGGGCAAGRQVLSSMCVEGAFYAVDSVNCRPLSPRSPGSPMLSWSRRTDHSGPLPFDSTVHPKHRPAGAGITRRASSSRRRLRQGQCYSAAGCVPGRRR